MDEEAREDATNLLQHQYPPSPVNIREGLLEERPLDNGTEESENDDECESVTTPEKRDIDARMADSSEEIEMTELGPSSSLSVDCSLEEVVEKQPTSSASVDATESPSDFELHVPTSSEPEGSIGRIGSSSGSGIVERLKLAIDGRDEEDLSISPRPTKSQVLHYFARAHKFSIRRVERDIQITDADGFPLFDAYADADCAGRIWTIESYGKPVLFMRDYTSSDWCQRTTRAHVAVRDWNGDYFGELLPGDPFYMHSAERKVVAKMVRHGSSLPQIENGACSEESTALTASLNSAGALLVANKPSCWLCVHEESERHIARLEDYKSIQFNKDVAFQLKLLSLAAIIRLVGQVGLTPAAKCVGAVKTILNCCAGY